MKTVLMMTTVLGALLCGAGAYVDCAPDDTFHWRTCVAERATINWVFPEGARSARLVVTDMKGSATTNVIAATTGDSCAWSAPEPASDGDETVYDFTLDFFASADASGTPLVGKSQSARGVGCVRTTSASARLAEVDSREWLRVPSLLCVLPLPAGATALTRGGEPVNAAEMPGWYGWTDVANGADTAWMLDAVERLLRGTFGGTTVLLR